VEFKQPNRRYERVAPRPQTPPRSAPAPVVAPQPVEVATPPAKPAETPKRTQFPFNRKTIVIAGAILLAVIILGIVLAQVLNQTAAPKAAIIEETGYQTILPNGKSIKSLGGWERISPMDSDPVYAFADRIGDVSISVSEQPLPPAFSSAPDQQLAQLATAYSATNKIDAGGTTAYIGTNAKGPQSTLFVKKGLLVLIKSQQKIEDKDWITYISSLN